MPVVTALDITRSYGTHAVLTGVSVAIRRGERVGVVGANGTGKSTLGKILAGVEPADGGLVTRRRDAVVMYLDQAPRLPLEVSACDVALSGLEAWCEARARYESANRQLADTGDLSVAAMAQAHAAEDLERLGGWDLVHRAESILGHLGIDDTTRAVGQMSGGEQRRVALARVLIARPDLAVLDEPTNHLDVATVAWLERHLIEEYEGAVLLITHDRYLLDRVAERTIEVGRGVAVSYDGGYETYLQARAERMALDERTEKNRQNFLRSELEWLRRQPKARAGKSKARIQRVENAVAQVRRTEAGVAQIGAAEVRSGKTILELDHVSLELGDRCLVRPHVMHVTLGERIGVVGPNGCGKSTLLRTLVGEVEPTAGRVVRGANTRVAYLDQMRATLDDRATVFENVIGNLAVIRVGERDTTPRAYLERFLFDEAGQRSVVGSLSGGERARVALAALLAQPANLMILDEPTNDLDIPTLAALESFLLEFGGTAIVVTHDRYFLDRIATSILAFEEDGRLRRFHGSYTSYLEQVEASGAPAADRAEDKARRRAAVAAAKLSFREERELASLPELIEAAEVGAAQIESRLADPTLYARGGDEAAALLAELARLQADAARWIDRWEELETKKERASRA
jgi:ATP-binding cassette subfamily F protein uup